MPRSQRRERRARAHRMTRNGLLLGTLAWAGFALPTHAQIIGGVVRIGVLTDIASSNGDSAGMGSVAAARMAVEEFGGKVAGKPVEVVFADHQGKPDIGAGIAREWLDRGGVDAIVDVPQSAVALAVMPLVEAADKVALFSGAGASVISGKACSPNSVQWSYTTYGLATALGHALVADGGKKWFFVTADYTFGQELEAQTTDAVRAAGGRVLGDVRAPFNTTDFSSYFVTAGASGADVVALANVAADTRTSILAAHEFGLTAHAKLAALLLDTLDVKAVGLDAAAGLYAVDPFYWDRTDATRAWSQRFQDRIGRKPSMIQAGVYSAVRHYLAAVNATGSDKGSVVVPQMRRTPVHDMFAENGRLREDGLMVHDMYLMRVKTAAQSRGPWDVFEIVRTIPAAEAAPRIETTGCPPERRTARTP